MQKKEFIKPEMKKCEQPLDKVTLHLRGYGGCNTDGDYQKPPFPGIPS